MQVEIKIDRSCSEPKVIILTASITEEVNALAAKLAEGPPQILSGSRAGKVEVLEQGDVIRLYASAGKVFAVAERGE